jgi:long-chain acyl-CoA synthetase
VKRNLNYHEKVHGMSFMGLYSKNRYEWLLADWACVLFGITSVPLYDTLGVENLSYCLKQTELTTMFVSA